MMQYYILFNDFLCSKCGSRIAVIREDDIEEKNICMSCLKTVYFTNKNRRTRDYMDRYSATKLNQKTFELIEKLCI